MSDTKKRPRLSPWFDPNWRKLYAAFFEQMKRLEQLHKAAGHRIRPKQ